MASMKKKMNVLYWYGKSPIWLQNIGISLYGILLHYQRYGKIYRKYLDFYQKRKHISLRAEKKRQNVAFLRLLHYAVNRSPFYQELYKEIDLSQIKSVEDISLLPIVSKEMLRKNIQQVYTIHKGKAIKFRTGGTTGTPMLVFKRKQDVQKRMAYLDSYKREFGFINNKMPSARFFGKNIIPDQPTKPVFWRMNYWSKQRYYSTYHMKEDNMIHYINDLNKFKPMAIDGFVSAIYELAKYIELHNIVLTFQPLVVFTTAETVLPYHREKIERVFGCQLSDQYASNEGAPFIRQCSHGSYHENIDTGVFEHIATPFGSKLVVTSFDSYGTPLIRYDIGDRVVEGDGKKCSCGSCHPVIKGLDGRETDYLLSPSKGKLHMVNLSVMVAELPDCFENIQFIQRTDQSIDVKIVVVDPCDKELYQDLIIDKMKAYVGEDMDYHVEQVDYIVKENSGKYRMIVNRMEDGNGN